MPSTSDEWKNLLNGLGSKPTYTSQYQNQIDTLLDKITNREQFSYDFNADPLYQQYKDQYTKLGNEASMNAVANASAMTGGFGSSYATTAAAQANQQYLNQMNDMIPELYNAALSKYKMETEDLLNKYSVTSDAENRNYGQYRDSVADYYTDRDYYTNGYNNALGFEYQKERDAIADAQYAAQMAYQKERDSVSDSQWNQSFNYNKERDTVSDNQWNQSFNYSKERDAVSDAQWQQQYELSKRNAAQSAANAAASLAYQRERAAAADAQWQKEFDYQKEKDAASQGGYSMANNASDADFSRYAHFAQQFANEQSLDYAYDYITRLYEDEQKISEYQAMKLMEKMGLI